MATSSLSFEANASYEITSSNESWRAIMDSGLAAPAVTGGTIQLPQGGTAESHAAVTGGIFSEGAEAGTLAEENARKLIDAVLPGEIGSRIEDVLNGDSLSDIEFFLTNIAKSEYSKIAGEFQDNENETLATNMVIDSLHVELTLSGFPSMQEIIEKVREYAMEQIKAMLGGVA